METNSNDQKRIWTSPELIVHGDVAEITGLFKEIREPSDGFFLKDTGDPLKTVS